MKDRDLVRLHWPRELRPAFDALFDIDRVLGDVVVRSTQPALGAIKLAWWREALERLDSGPAPAEPRLKAASAHLLPEGITGQDLAQLVPGWSTLLDEWPESAMIARRGADLFGYAARLLRIGPAGLSDAGALYATVDVARTMNNAGWLSAADELGGLRYPPRARPLTALAALAERDLRRFRAHGWEAEATPGRSFTILKHRLTGFV